MEVQQNHQTHIKPIESFLQDTCTYKLGKYSLLLGDYHKGNPYLTIGPHHLTLWIAFLAFNLLTFSIQYFFGGVEETQSFFIVLNAITIMLDILWLSTALINPGIATQGSEGGEVCKTCVLQNQIQIALKQDRVHCQQCGICIDKHQNHMSLLGCCVGKNNFVLFKLLLLAIVLWGLTVLTIFLVSCSQ